MKAEYVATKSAWAAITLMRVVFCWLIVPVVLMVIDLFVLKSERIEFYENQVISKSGIINKKTRKSAFLGVTSVYVDQRWLGRILGFGDVKVDVTGRWDINTKNVKDPQGLAEYLESKIITKENTTSIIHN
ncbi:MAG: PH domain-containing protein [Erysipelotrichaceae bacterium]|nr:PH domain-containing protein [Erysipelotrichaceae bacterium]